MDIELSGNPYRMACSSWPEDADSRLILHIHSLDHESSVEFCNYENSVIQYLHKSAGYGSYLLFYVGDWGNR
jgi:hypothetical protein